jgi:cytidylate kinase
VSATEHRPLRFYLAGPAGSGKSTVAGLLAERHGFVRVSLGDIPRALAAARGLQPERAVLQALGDEIRRSDPGRLARVALVRLGGAARAVVDGVRLPAEAEALHAAGLVGVWVAAPYPVRRRRLRERGERWLRGEDRHRTEEQVASIRTEHEIDASGDLSALTSAVSALVAALEAQVHARGGAGCGDGGPRRPEP